MLETWKTIPIEGLKGEYEASSMGRIRRSERSAARNAGEVRKQQTTRRGYRILSLRCDGKNVSFGVHRLVALAFVDGDHSLDVNHEDGVKANNVPSNLEWATKAENNAHARKTGLWNLAMHGPVPGSHKLVDAEMVLNIRSRFDGKWGGLTKLSRQLGLKYSTVHAIVTRRSWAHV